ncbi:MAG: M23 family metallopeptidase [Micromonosporaceae bacterium]|jgi:murein DD-endopeptidase MepM/ murein hydrolase activator NlpD|nr:M23 family metallopeptidase [Micromonosporaceae bacterium]
MRRAVLAAALASALLLLCFGGAASALLLGLEDDGDSFTLASGRCGIQQTVDPDGKLPQLSNIDADQMRNAAIIVSVAQQMGVPPRGWVIGVATALQESWLRNLPDLGPRNDHDSIGLFQQRPSMGWGTPEQLQDPAYAARKFFEKLVKVEGWQRMPLTDAAQAVQRSAYPDAYAKHEPLATQIVDALTGGGARAAGSETHLRCASQGEIAASGWTAPVKGALVGSGFRTAQRRDHQGVDLIVARDTPIHAAAAGEVLVSMCQATDNCVGDGGVNVRGCGWYVDILHAGNVITRYCHMGHRPQVRVGQTVAAGQVIGYVGSTGHSSGPHLHFEVHLNGDGHKTGAVDPVRFMADVGAPLESR